jgi:serine/threonine protein kinase
MLVAGKYRLNKMIGSGAIGKVYLAHHVRLRNSSTRVVKVIKQEILDTPGTIERFYREVQVTSTLSEQNEHIIRVYDDFGEIPRLGYFYVMEYIDGLSLRDYQYQVLKKGEKMPVEMALDIFAQLCNAMMTAHHVGVVHRDLKPDNMMLAKRGDTFPFVKVLDWGIAKPTGSLKETDLHLTKGSIGTPLYMSPEQLLNEGVDHRSDQYSMGLILYEMLSGDNPFLVMTGKDSYNTQALIKLMEAQLYKMPPLLSEFSDRTDLPPELDRIIEKMLAKQPRERYSGIDVLLADLEPVLARYRLDSGPRRTMHNRGLHSSETPVFALDEDESDTIRIPTGNVIQQEISSTMAGAATAIADGVFRPPTEEKSSSSLPLMLLLFLSLVIVGGGGTWWFLKKKKTTSAATPARRVTPRRVTPRPLPARPAPRRVALVTPDAGTTRPDVPSKAPARLLPRRVAPRKAPARRITRRRVVRRRVARRRVIRRRVVRRPVSPCGTDNVLLKFSPSLSSSAEVSAGSGKKAKRLSGRRYCVPKKAGRVSILMEGYSLCIFTLPRGRSSVRIRLLPEGKRRSNTYCVR